MEQLNRIEIRGVIGSLKLQTFSETVMARITVATNYAYKFEFFKLLYPKFINI